MSLSPEEFDQIYPGWEVWANGEKVGLVASKVIGRDGLYLDVEIETPVEREVRLPFQYVGGVEAGESAPDAQPGRPRLGALDHEGVTRLARRGDSIPEPPIPSLL